MINLIEWKIVVLQTNYIENSIDTRARKVNGCSYVINPFFVKIIYSRTQQIIYKTNFMRSPLAKKIIFTLYMIFLLVLVGQAQSNLVFYHSNDQLNAPNLNPAFLFSQKRFTLSFFPVSGMSVGYNNQEVINDMIFNVIQGNQSTEQFREVFRSILKLGLFYQRMEVPVFNFGYNSGRGSFNFRIKDNMRLMTDLKGEISDFLVNSNSLSVTLNKAQTFPVHAMYYREYSLGYANEIIRKKLIVGFRAKVYFGKFSLISDVQGEAYRDETNEYYFSTSNQLKLSFPAKIVRSSEDYLTSINASDDFTMGNFLFNSKNSGLGFDVGFNYKVNSDFEFSASVIDIGSINWKSNLNSMNYIGKYPFNPDYINFSESDAERLVRTEDYPALTEDIPELFKIDTISEAYNTNMPLTIYTGLKYRINSELTISAVNRYIKVNNLSYNSFSVVGDYKMNKNLNLITGYGILGNSYTNIPLAIVYSFTGGQYFVGTDNCLSYLLPKISDFSGITFGASIYLFNKKVTDKRAIDYLPFFELKRP